MGPISPKRGLRQGDPLSPYLFLFCVEVLSNSLDLTAEKWRIHGCRISPNALEITHLLFAEDSFLFFKATTEEATHIKSIMENYATESGQAVNFMKSGMFCSSNVRQDKQEELSGILWVYNDISSSNYLRLSSLVGRSKKRVFSFLKDRVIKRIDGWKAKPISRAEKSILIKNVAQALPSYCMTFFLLPKSLLQEIERLFTAYWWSSASNRSKGIRWTSRGAMCEAKCKVGPRFKNMYGFNIALLGKHV